MEKIINRLNALRRIFAQYDAIACVYIFGSIIKGNITKTSDIDFAVLTKDGDKPDPGSLAYEIEKVLDFIAPVELVFLDYQKLLLQFKVLKEGKIVYEGDKKARVRFEMRVIKEMAAQEQSFKVMKKFRIPAIIKNLKYESA